MQRLTTTPFGRTVSPAVLKTADLADADISDRHIDKWEVFRKLCTARRIFGVSDRDLTVLNALLSFHPGSILGDDAPLIVFPSNRALSERAHGMAESTLRRHLAALVNAGLVLRHDSPNGKRYARRGAGGEVVRAFGFDLTPLLMRAADIARAAKASEEAALRLRMRREDISLMRRDALNLVLYGQEQGIAADWESLASRLMDTHRLLRRKLDADALDRLWKAVHDLLTEVQDLLCETEEMDGNAADSERLYQSSHTDSFESEPSLEEATENTESSQTRIPLALVLKACPDMQPYATHDIRHWHELIGVATLVRGMMGISLSAWNDAQKAMGPQNASAVVAAILQRVDDIRNPGGYLRRLTEKAQEGRFSPGPMIMALLRGAES